MVRYLSVAIMQSVRNNDQTREYPIISKHKATKHRRFESANRKTIAYSGWATIPVNRAVTDRFIRLIDEFVCNLLNLTIAASVAKFSMTVIGDNTILINPIALLGA